MNMYYLALVLPPHLNEQVLEWKYFFRDAYGCKVGLKSPAHITLIPPFWMQAHQEEALLTEVDRFAATREPFELHTNGFSAFRPRTIFVAVQHSDPLDQLKHDLEETLAAHTEFGIRKEGRPFHPHITLATRDLQKKDFFDAWPRFEAKRYDESWTAAGISVLRHNRHSWDVWHTSPFGAGEEFTNYD